MAELARFGLLPFGADGLAALIRTGVVNLNPVTQAIASLNNGWSARFLAHAAKIVTGFRVSWSTVTAGGTVRARLEGNVAASGVPNGTLHDANATKDFTPVAGAQQVTFSPAPTTPLVAGTIYHMVLLTTVGGTAHTIRSHWGAGDALPGAALYAADATTRSNLAEIAAGRCPIMTLVFSDGTEESFGMCPFYDDMAKSVYGSNRAGAKISVLSNTIVRGIQFMVGKTGSPTGDLNVKIIDQGGSTVSGADVTIPAICIGTSVRAARVGFPNVTLNAGGSPYRVVISSAAAGVGAPYSVGGIQAFSNKFVPANCIFCWDDGSWHDEDTVIPAVELLLDDISIPGAGLLVPSSALGGVNG